MSRLGFRRVAARLLRAELHPAPPTDAELLARFAATRDEPAFAELVSRHGGLVRGTARRYLGDSHAAEDVCQAAFLILARKAGAGGWGPTVGPWLYAVAVRLARKVVARTTGSARLRTGYVPNPPIDPAAAAVWGEIVRALDDELAALPERLRAPLVLCYLEGRTRDEAAHAVGCSLAMLKRHLERGRNLLRDRLTRRGITLPAVGLGLLVSETTIGAAAVEATARAAVVYALSGKAPSGAAALLAVSHRGVWMNLAVLVAALTVGGIGLAVQAGSKLTDDPKNPAPVARAADELQPDVEDDRLPDAAVARLGTTRLRAGGSVERMAFSPDGTKLASWSGDSHTTDALVIWDTKSGRALRRVDLPGARLDQLVWTSDGLGIALIRSSYDDPTALIWEFTDEKGKQPEVKPRVRGGGAFAVPNEPPPDNEGDSCYAISPDGKTLAVGRAGAHEGKERAVRLDTLRTGVKVDALAPGKEVAKHPDNCGELYFSPDSKTLVVFTRAKYLGNDKFENEQLVTVWDIATAKEKARFKAPRPANNGRPAVTLSNSTLAIGLEKGDTSLWDLTTGKERKLATGHDSKTTGTGRGFGTYAVAFTPDGKWLLTGGADNVTKVWEVESGKHLRTLERHYTCVVTLAASPIGKLVASAGHDGITRIWDATTGADACPQPGHKYAVGNVAISQDGKTAVTAGWDDTLRWWHAGTGAEQRVINVSEGIEGLTLSPDNKTVLIATDDGKLRTWDAGTGRETTPANLPRDVKFGMLSFTPNGRHLIAAHGPMVTIWEWPALKLARTIDLPKPANQPGENHCNSLAVSPDGKWLVTVAHRYWYREENGLKYGYTSDGVVDVWDFATGKRVRRLVEGDVFRSGTFTADGRFVLMGGAAGTIPAQDGKDAEEFKGEMNLLDPIAGRWIRGFEVPPVPKSVALRYSGASALSPDGRTLYMSYNTGDIVAFEVATGSPRRTLTGHRGYIGSLAFSADARRLISGSRDGTALVWDITLAGAAPPRREADTEKLWRTASGGEAKAAYAAMADLAASPDKAIEILRKYLKPAPAAPTAAALDRIFAELGNDEFATREKATKELTEYGESAVADVRKRLGGIDSPEAKRRALAFLKEFDRAASSPTRVLQARVVELLEGIGTPAAKKSLAELGAGAPAAPLTVDAAAALKRLGDR